MIQRSEEMPSPVQIAIFFLVKSLPLLDYQRISIIRKVTGGALNNNKYFHAEILGENFFLVRFVWEIVKSEFETLCI